MTRHAKKNWLNAFITAALMLPTSLALGLLLGFIGSYVGALVMADSSGMGSIVGAVAGFILGYPLGAYLGVFLIGRWRAPQGSWLFALLGGVAAFVVMLILAEPLRLNLYPRALSVAYIAAFPIGMSAGWLLRSKERGREATPRRKSRRR